MPDTGPILILAPHTDDGELGCGASIAKHLAAGRNVVYIAFSTCSQSLPAHLPADTLSVECREANRILGVDPDKVLLFDFEVRHLLTHRQQVLEQLIRINQQWQPHTVYLPAEHDIHQDHQVVYAEGMRAFKNSNVLGYELPWNNPRFQPNYFEKIDETLLQRKIETLKAYRSQSHRKYMSPDFTRALAVVRGIQCNAPLAEAFESYRIVNR